MYDGELLDVSTDDIGNVFKALAKEGPDGKGYINVMQFSSIFRKSTCMKGNLFKEMKVFNSRLPIYHLVNTKFDNWKRI
jgi:hypothetical protein